MQVHQPLCSLIFTEGGGRELAVFSNSNELDFLYSKNYLFFLKYPFYAGIYVAIFLMIWFVEKIIKRRTELKFETEKRIAELQLKSIKNQLDPHFTLNIINSIGSLFYKKDNEKADYVFSKYSKLLRSTILNSDKIVTTLADELEYVENYLELERFRSDGKFSWELKVDTNIDKQIKIPKMLIHTFVENSIKHGLRHLEKAGKLSISISDNFDSSKIIIQDNGVGRRRANEIEFGNTERGLKILDQILDLYFNLMKVKITYNIEDLIDYDKNSLGTEVNIEIPINNAS